MKKGEPTPCPPPPLNPPLFPHHFEKSARTSTHCAQSSSSIVYMSEPEEGNYGFSRANTSFGIITFVVARCSVLC